MTGRGWQAERLSGATRVRPTDDERNPPAGAHLAKHVGGWRRRGRRWGEVGALWPVRSQCEPTTDAPRERAHSRTRESRTSSKSTSVLGENADICSPVAWSRTTPSYGCTSITSPIFSRDTSISSGSAPAGRWRWAARGRKRARSRASALGRWQWFRGRREGSLRAGILHRIEEDGRDLAADAQPARPLVRHVRDVVAHVPQDGVGRRLAR